MYLFRNCVFSSWKFRNKNHLEAKKKDMYFEFLRALPSVKICTNAYLFFKPPLTNNSDI